MATSPAPVFGFASLSSSSCQQVFITHALCPVHYESPNMSGLRVYCDEQMYLNSTPGEVVHDHIKFLVTEQVFNSVVSWSHFLMALCTSLPNFIPIDDVTLVA